MTEYKSFFKTVGGNEGSKCRYSTRLDTYGKGCAHDCSYCYARSLLDFRGLWHPEEPSVADIGRIRRKVEKLAGSGITIRLGGMTDCFQPAERRHRVTYETIKALNENDVHYLIVTKSPMVAEDGYLDVMDKGLAHIQVTVTSTDDGLGRKYEKAPPMSERIRAIERLQMNGFDVALRLSPFIPQFIDFDRLNEVECDKILIEFLRVNPWIEKWLGMDCSEWTVKHGGYRHIPLERKIEFMEKIKGFREISVCEDEDEAYGYWKANVNHNPDDCCNLRRTDDG